VTPIFHRDEYNLSLLLPERERFRIGGKRLLRPPTGYGSRSRHKRFGMNATLLGYRNLDVPYKVASREIAAGFIRPTCPGQQCLLAHSFSIV
jgi:hypothetical protein